MVVGVLCEPGPYAWIVFSHWSLVCGIHLLSADWRVRRQCELCIGFRSEENERNYVVRQRYLLAYRTHKYVAASIINHVYAQFNIRVAR